MQLVTQLSQSRRQVHDVLSAAESVPPICSSSNSSSQAHSSEPASCRRCCRSTGQTDGQTDSSPFHGPCSAHDADIVRNVCRRVVLRLPSENADRARRFSRDSVAQARGSEVLVADKSSARRQHVEPRESNIDDASPSCWFGVKVRLLASVDQSCNNVVFFSVLFCSLAVLDPRVGHPTDVLTTFSTHPCPLSF